MSDSFLEKVKKLIEEEERKKQKPTHEMIVELVYGDKLTFQPGERTLLIWVETPHTYPIPMVHVSPKNARQLIKILGTFASHGHLPTQEEMEVVK